MALPASHASRMATAIVLLALVAGAVIWPDVVLFPLVLAVSLAGLWEFYGLAWPGADSLALKLCGLVIGSGVIMMLATNRPAGALGLCLAGLWLENVRFLAAFGRGAKVKLRARLAFGLLYVPVGLGFIFGFSPKELILAILVVMAADAGGFYAGSLWGKHPLWPKVSPKKTWEGFAGGLGACVAVCLVYGGLFGSGSPAGFAALGVWLFAAAFAGDFVESALKRHHKVKDSGSLLPGHGGVLDRVDSLLAVVPAYALVKSFYPLFA